MEILPDIPMTSQLAIHAEVMKIAEECNLPFKSAFYILMKRYKQALALSRLERISIEEAILKLSQVGYWESLAGREA